VQCLIEGANYTDISTSDLPPFFVQIVVATFVQSIRAQVEIHAASSADSADTSGQETASKIQAVKAYSSRATIRRYLDPLDWSKYYIRYTDSDGNVKFINHTCPNTLVFNPSSGQCTFSRDDIKNPPQIPYINGGDCNGTEGYYCNGSKFTYCTADKQKIVQGQSCPSDVCKSGKNPCPSNKGCS
jgi:hypothetical protein